MIRVDGDVGIRADWNLIARSVIDDIDEGHSAALARWRAKVLQGASRLHLAGRNRVQQNPDLPLEHAARHGVKGDLRLVAGGRGRHTRYAARKLVLRAICRK